MHYDTNHQLRQPTSGAALDWFRHLRAWSLPAPGRCTLGCGISEAIRSGVEPVAGSVRTRPIRPCRITNRSTPRPRRLRTR